MKTKNNAQDEFGGCVAGGGRDKITREKRKQDISRRQLIFRSTYMGDETTPLKTGIERRCMHDVVVRQGPSTA